MLTLQIKDEILHSQKEQGVLVLISTAENENFYYKLTGLGAQVFKGLSEKRDLENIINDILNDYDVTEEQLRADVNRFISYLLENGIAERV